MKIWNPILAGVFLFAVLIAVGLIAQSNRNASRDGAGNRPQYEYATLTTQILEDDNGQTSFQLIWNAGVVDFVGRSTTSLEDARRRLEGQLRIRNNSRANLSVLLTGIGQDGWRLIETNQNLNGNTRVFIRAAQ